MISIKQGIEEMNTHEIILFDGACNLCDKSVQFIIKWDPQGHYKFASLQSDAGQKILQAYRIPENINSFILIEGDRYFIKSTAALRVCRNLEGLWKLMYVFLIVPRPIRDFFYNVVAQNRYKWFGEKDSCMLPSPALKKRFLE